MAAGAVRRGLIDRWRAARRGRVAVLGLIIWPALSAGQALQDTGMEAYLAGDYNLARQSWEDLALQGDARSIFLLGLLHFQGTGVGRDPPVAAQYFRQAAAEDFVPAQFFLGLMYRDGDGVEADAAQSAQWLSRAAMAGHRHAQYLLGSAFAAGRGVEADRSRALGWWRRAAAQGSVEAAARLRELDPSVEWTASLARPDPMGSDPVRSIRQRTTQRQRDELFRGQQAFIRRDYQTALDAWRPLAEAGMAEAQYGLGFMLESGWGVEHDPGAAADWYRRAAEKGHPKAQLNLGRMYLAGSGVEQDRGMAIYWIQNAADNGELRAAEMLKNLEGRPEG